MSEAEHVRESIDGLGVVGFDAEFGVVHDPETDCGTDAAPVDPQTLDPEECFACRRCWGYPGTEEELDELLAEKLGDDNLPDGPGTLAGWSA